MEDSCTPAGIITMAGAAHMNYERQRMKDVVMMKMVSRATMEISLFGQAVSD